MFNPFVLYLIEDWGNIRLPHSNILDMTEKYFIVQNKYATKNYKRC